jgi:hypothetical protein
MVGLEKLSGAELITECNVSEHVLLSSVIQHQSGQFVYETVAQRRKASCSYELLSECDCWHNHAVWCKVFVSKREEVTEGQRKLHNEKLRDLYFSPHFSRDQLE